MLVQERSIVCLHRSGHRQRAPRLLNRGHAPADGPPHFFVLPHVVRSPSRRIRREGGAILEEPELTTKTTFPRVTREPRLSDKVASLLLETIVARRLAPGERLPSERELGEQFGVSRTVIREAVRALAAKGVIDVRTGSGLRVAAVDSSTVSESMSLFLHGSSTVDYPRVHEVREMLEVEVAGLAAERATEEDIAAMTTICGEMEAESDVDAAALQDVEFHRAIARATHNELHLLLLDSLGNALLEIRRENLAGGSGRDTLASHREILERIAARDPEGARSAMRAHLANVEEHWRRRSGQVVTPART
jgi:GntR family transcriptional regulator, transcriptional repressor for pyruvate dehydrogenase complex